MASLHRLGGPFLTSGLRGKSSGGRGRGGGSSGGKEGRGGGRGEKEDENHTIVIQTTLNGQVILLIETVYSLIFAYSLPYVLYIGAEGMHRNAGPKI